MSASVCPTLVFIPVSVPHQLDVDDVAEGLEGNGADFVAGSCVAVSIVGVWGVAAGVLPTILAVHLKVWAS